jgi:oxaloacetate decarboxylase (Na+ extruding) subunit alpha
VLSLLGELGSRPSVHDLAVTKPGFRLSVRRCSEGTLSA